MTFPRTRLGDLVPPDRAVRKGADPVRLGDMWRDEVLDAPLGQHGRRAVQRLAGAGTQRRPPATVLVGRSAGAPDK